MSPKVNGNLYIFLLDGAGKRIETFVKLLVRAGQSDKFLRRISQPSYASRTVPKERFFSEQKPFFPWQFVKLEVEAILGD